MTRTTSKTKSVPKKRPAAKAPAPAKRKVIKPTPHPLAKTAKVVKTAASVAKTKTAPKPRRARERITNYSVVALCDHLATLFSASKPYRDEARPLRKLAAKHGIEVGTCSAGASADKWEAHVADLHRALQRKGIEC